MAVGLERLRRLPPSDRPLFLRAWQALVRSRLDAGLRRIDWTEVLTERALKPAQVPIDRLVAVFEAARETCPVGTSCLPRSLALRRFLERHGVTTRLRLGARKVDGQWSGHVWVESDGRLVGDRPELVREFVPFRETA